MKTTSQELELTVIGETLNNNSFYQKSRLKTEMFVDPLFRDIWQVMSKVIQSGKAVDSATIMDELKSDSLREVLTEALRGAWSPTMSEAFAERITKNHRSREIQSIGQQLINTPDSANEAIRKLMAIGQAERTFNMPVKQALSDAVKHIDTIAQQNGLAGVTTGLQRVDAVLGGFHNSDFIVLAARPAMGKTALMINMVITSDCPTGVFSAEMGSTQIGERMLAISSGVEAQKLRKGTIDTEDFSKMVTSCNNLSKKDIWINDKPAPTLDEIVNQARQWKLDNNIQLIFIDYLQRIKLPGNTPRHERVGEAARVLKELARELDIPIVVLAQVNRQAEGRRPNMGDLAQSGEIEAEADQIIFLYRDEVYNDNTEDAGIAELLVSKNRHGDIGMIKCAWIAPSMQFKNLSLVEGY